jgi:hypothetical protein
MDDLLKMLKDGTLSNVLSSVGKVASVFNPAVGGGLMLASNITDSMATIDDDFLENNIVGLSGSAEMLEKMVENKNVDYDKLLMIANNLKSMSEFSQKTAKLIK